MRSNVRSPNLVPVFADCAWYGGQPDDFASGGTGSRPAPTVNWAVTSWDWYYDMARFCMARHGRAIQASFVDGSARKVQLTGLWDLQWHQTFQRTGYVALPW